MEARREGFRVGVYKAVALFLGAAAVYIVVLALSSPLHTIRAHSLPLLALALAAGAVGWLGWREERTEHRRAAGREAAARERIDTELRRDDGSGELHARIEELERELAATAGVEAKLQRALAESEERLEREVAEVEERREREVEQAEERRRRDLAEANEKTTRLKNARDAERAWNRELRRQVVEMDRARGLLGDTHDVRALVLHIAVTLLEAEKGILLSRN